MKKGLEATQVLFSFAAVSDFNAALKKLFSQN
jgi:hypothetical protein